ncbi:hypothetical protein K7432_012014 [Basidiobolus ranarum]|uniref:Dehydrin n=1 Tax=Basidiobolus ranarum TaxID=34480 RepID=A0ABR2VSY4_9FUNG
MTTTGYGNQDSDCKKEQEKNEKHSSKKEQEKNENHSPPTESHPSSTKSSVQTPISSDVGGSNKLPKSTEDVENSVRKNVAHED